MKLTKKIPAQDMNEIEYLVSKIIENLGTIIKIIHENEVE